MKSSAFYTVIGIGVLLVAGVIWWGVVSHSTPSHSPVQSTKTVAATTTPPLTGMSIYTNGVYGFSVFYPESDLATSTFSTFYHLPNLWRMGALPDATGTPIYSIVGYRIQNTATYPRYFDAEVRIGASKDPRELAACTKVGDGEMPKADVVMNGTTWKVFASQDAGMMQYAQGVSYRTIHDGQCVAVEQIETGSSYRDDQPSSKDIPDSVLTQKYANLDSIVKSFSFVNP